MPRIVNARRWMWLGSVLVCLASIALLVTAFRPGLYTGRQVSSVLLALVLTALLVAIALHVRFLILAKREHRETANALEATEREFKSVFDNALDGILILDDRGTCLEANPAAQIMFGTRRDELVGHPIGNFCAWKQFLDPRYEHRETQVLRGDGKNIFVEYTAKAHYLPGRHVAVLRDISRRKQAEAALRESDERFQQMATNIQETFWMLDAENLKVIYVNPAYEKSLAGPASRSRKIPNPTKMSYIPRTESAFSLGYAKRFKPASSTRNSASSNLTMRLAGCGSADFRSGILSGLSGAW